MESNSTPSEQMGLVEEPDGNDCYLLRLSGELRTRIYELVLVVHENPDQAVIITSTKKTKTPDAKPTVLALLATCRLINSEAAGIFYNLNNLHVPYHWFQRLNHFLDVTSASRFAGINKLTVFIDGEGTIEHVCRVCKRIGARMPRLQTLSMSMAYRRGVGENAVEVLVRERYWMLRSLVKVPGLKEFNLVQERFTNIRPALSNEEDLLKEWAEELSIQWSKKSGMSKTLRWEFD